MRTRTKMEIVWLSSWGRGGPAPFWGTSNCVLVLDEPPEGLKCDKFFTSKNIIKDSPPVSRLLPVNPHFVFVHICVLTAAKYLNKVLGSSSRK